MKNVEIFNSPMFGELRTSRNEKGEPIFCLKDVCDSLGLQVGATAKRLGQKVISSINVLTNGDKNMTTEGMMVDICDKIRRRIDALRELLKLQKETMAFLVKEGLDDSKEGEAIAESIGEMIKSFGDVLPDNIYNKIIEGEV